MKSSKVFWGIFFILAAVYVVISKFGILPDIGVFSIILTVFLHSFYSAAFVYFSSGFLSRESAM